VLSLPPAFALSQDQTLKLDEILYSGFSHVLRMTTFGTLSIDEVHPLIETYRPAMYLKRRPPKSLPKPPLRRIASHKKVARKDPAVHVSLSSDSLFKQPGDQQKSPTSSRPEGRRSPCIREPSDTISLFQ
jgi:hypothetical protein